MAGLVDFKISCSFCEEGFTSDEALMDHLMMCGNKTDQCPNCEEYIRRAIFAYHYENGCANFEEPTTDNEKHNKPQSSNGILVTVKCPYCNENYDKSIDQNHRKNCRLNPENSANGQHQPLYPGLDQTSDQSRQYNDSHDDVRIPCEWCGQGLPLHLFENHSKACRDQEHKRLEEKSRSADHLKTNESLNSPSSRRPSQILVPAMSAIPAAFNNAFGAIKAVVQYVLCKFCGKSISSQGHQYHELHCVKNARRNKNS